MTFFAVISPHTISGFCNKFHQLVKTSKCDRFVLLVLSVAKSIGEDTLALLFIASCLDGSRCLYNIELRIQGWMCAVANGLQRKEPCSSEASKMQNMVVRRPNMPIYCCTKRITQRLSHKPLLAASLFSPHITLTSAAPYSCSQRSSRPFL